MIRFFKSLKASLFGSISKSAFTILWVLIFAVPLYQFFQWAFLQGSFLGESRLDCKQSGACWVFIKQNLDSFLYGTFFPMQHKWRVQVLFLVLMGHFLLLILLPLRKLNYVLVSMLGVLGPSGYILLFGGWFSLAEIPSARIGGLALTILISYVGILTSLPLGVLLALGRRSKMPTVKLFSVLYIEFWRGVPLVTVLFMASVMLPLFLPQWVDPDHFSKFLRCLLGVALFSAAYMAEVVRGGLQSIAKGQEEASLSLGLSYFQTMIHIVLPQALTNVIPAIVGNFISLFKDTTLVMIVGMFDFLGAIQGALTNAEWLSFNLEGYIFAGVIFWIFCFGLSMISKQLEGRLKRGVV